MPDDKKRIAELEKEVERLRRPLLSFIETIEATGGVSKNLEPVADEDWQDLGEAYAEACSALGHEMKVRGDDA